jgi:hypothetical protein
LRTQNLKLRENEQKINYLKVKRSHAPGLTPVILAIWKAEIGKIVVQDLPQQIVPHL